MFRLIFERLVQIIPVVIGATFISFGLIYLIPGDIATSLAGEHASPDRLKEIRSLYNLDQSFIHQYFNWLSEAVRGQLGRSLFTNESVHSAIIRSFPPTASIVILSITISIVIGIPLGIFSAKYNNKWQDRAIKLLSTIGLATPNFWIGGLLIIIFSLKFQWLPASGYISPKESFSSWGASVILPAVAIGFAGASEITRQVKDSLVIFLQSLATRTLYSKGLSNERILWHHGLKNVAVNLVTVIALLINRMLGATVVIEAVFAISGLGTLIVEAATQKDFPIIQGVTLTMVMVVILVNLVADIIYMIVDPRVTLNLR